jgi:hypothetical protein
MTERTYARCAAGAACRIGPRFIRLHEFADLRHRQNGRNQLADDLSSAFFFFLKHETPIDYKPRPELVKPAPGQKEALPAPQDSIQTASSDWPESPEQRRARLRADATAHQADPHPSHRRMFQ